MADGHELLKRIMRDITDRIPALNEVVALRRAWVEVERKALDEIRAREAEAGADAVLMRERELAEAKLALAQARCGRVEALKRSYVELQERTVEVARDLLAAQREGQADDAVALALVEALGGRSWWRRLLRR